MDIKLEKIKIKDLVKGFEDNREGGVVGYNGLLDIRPAYQREFIYSAKNQKAVIETVRKSFPLNVMYWADNGGTYEILDGQQRTLSICGFTEGDFSIEIDGKPKYFQNLTTDQKDQILSYELMIYICSGKESEKLEWFKTINIAGEKLTEQELRNAVFTGKWLVSAKKYFSKTGCPAANVSEHFISKNLLRQELLETALKWISNDDIENYMGKHQNNPNALEIWRFWSDLSNWVKATFPIKRKEMKSVDWGYLYNSYKDEILDSDTLESQIVGLMEDDEVTKKSGIYTYLLTKEEKHLSIRVFTSNQKRQVYEKQKGRCPHCDKSKKYEIEDMEADHIKPWSLGGKTELKNCQMLCKDHNRQKSNK